MLLSDQGLCCRPLLHVLNRKWWTLHPGLNSWRWIRNIITSKSTTAVWIRRAVSSFQQRTSPANIQIRTVFTQADFSFSPTSVLWGLQKWAWTLLRTSSISLCANQLRVCKGRLKKLDKYRVTNLKTRIRRAQKCLSNPRLLRKTWWTGNQIKFSTFLWET